MFSSIQLQKLLLKVEFALMGGRIVCITSIQKCRAGHGNGSEKVQDGPEVDDIVVDDHATG